MMPVAEMTDVQVDLENIRRGASSTRGDRLADP